MLTRILCIDDNQEIIDLFRKWFKARPVVFTGETDPEHALTLLDEGSHFDIILLDVKMPKLSGKDILIKIRKKYNKLDLPIIMVSAMDSVKDIVDLLEMDANDYITKPIHLDIVQARIETHLKMRSLFQEQKELQQARYKYQLLFENSPVGICFFDLNGVITDANEGLAMIIKESTDKLIGRNIFKEFVDEDLISILKTSVNGETNYFEGSCHQCFASTSKLYIKIYVAPVYDMSGNISGATAMFEDVSLQQKELGKLKIDSAFYNNIFEHYSTPVVVFDLALKLVKFNQKFRELVDTDLIIGQTYSSTVFSSKNCIVAKVIEKKKNIEVVGELLCKSGEIIQRRLNGISLLDSAGELSYILVEIFE